MIEYRPIETLESDIKNDLAAITGPLTGKYDISPIQGDASNRTYYRISGPQVESSKLSAKTIMLMVLADPDPHQKPEEITDSDNANKINELPFVNVQRQLSSIGLPVPELYRYNAKAGLLYMEDFGDTLLDEVAVGESSEAAEGNYREAIEWLVKFQVQGTRCKKDGYVAFTRQFDYNLYLYEFKHFLEYGIEAKGKTVSSDDLNIIERHFDEMSKRLAGFKRILCHRDYHSRNLLVKPDGTIGIIDFQDALMAHPQYDLASLLRDSYVVLPADMRDSLIAIYLEKWADATGEKPDPDEFREVFDLTSLHRNLKAAGRFDFIDIKKGNPKFIKYIPQTLGYIKENFLKYQYFNELHKTFARYVPELE